MGRAKPVVESESTLYQSPRDKRHLAITVKWHAALARVEALRKQNDDLLQAQRARSLEFEHRLFNGLQLIVSMLLLQCRTAAPLVAEQLNIAAARISAFGRVHRRLQLIDYEDKVEIKKHLQELCDDLTKLLFHEQFDQTIVVQSANCEIPTMIALPLGLIVSELITNSVKHAKSGITVRFESITPVSHSISVVDDGPGFPGGFDPASSKGLGMQIVQALVKEIGGELRFLTGNNGRGTRVTLSFFLPGPETTPPV
jgi:two-component system, sensor histidine kinase PdtaS